MKRVGDERKPCSGPDVTMVASEMCQQPNDICMHLLLRSIIVWETVAVDENTDSTKRRNKRDSRHRKE